MIEIKDLTPGESYACRFRVNDYQGIGLLLTRDNDQKLVKLKDTATRLEHVVPFEDIWDIDHVNWIESTEEP